MKYDILHEFRDRLNQEPGLKANTKKNYYQSVKNILADTYFDSVNDIPPSFIEQGIKSLDTKNAVSAAKRGFELFAEYYPELKLPENIGQISKQKRNYKKRKWEPLKLDKLQRTINSLKNDKLKYAYRLMLATGMRVSEVEQIRKQDITIKEGRIDFFIEDTKKGEPATIGCQESYVLQRLPELLTDLEGSDKVFYSVDTMKHEANAHGFECHDLRRACAKIKYRELKEQGVNAYEATNEVRKLLRHDRCRTTKIYLRRKII